MRISRARPLTNGRHVVIHPKDDSGIAGLAEVERFSVDPLFACAASTD